MAVDGTDLETWGAFQGSITTVEHDGEAAETQLMDGPPLPARTTKRAKVLAIGPDGRKQYTPDPDARAGHRSANGLHNAGPYIGSSDRATRKPNAARWKAENALWRAFGGVL